MKRLYYYRDEKFYAEYQSNNKTYGEITEFHNGEELELHLVFTNKLFDMKASIKKLKILKLKELK